MAIPWLPLLIELFGESKILLGQSTSVVRGQGKRELVLMNVAGGMMPGFFGEPGDVVDELDDGGKVLELKRARNGVASLFPILHGSEGGFDLSNVKLGHVALVPQDLVRVTS